MATPANNVEELATQEYKYGFVTEIEQETVPRGLNEEVIRMISAKKNEPEWLLEWRLKAYKHWLTMKEPTWANIKYDPIDYQEAYYYAARKQRPTSPRAWMKLTPNCSRLMKNWASR